MRPDGPQWSVVHDVPWDLNFLLWLRRQTGVSLDHAQWLGWIDRVAALPQETMDTALTHTAPSEGAAAAARAAWPAFTNWWEPRRLALEGGFELPSAMWPRLLAIMGRSDVRITLLHAAEPGRRCRLTGRGWLVADAFSAPEAWMDLLERIGPGTRWEPEP